MSFVKLAEKTNEGWDHFVDDLDPGLWFKINPALTATAYNDNLTLAATRAEASPKTKAAKVTQLKKIGMDKFLK